MKTLKEVLNGIVSITLKGDSNCHVEGMALDSRAVKAGFLFAALPGTAVDGSRFITSAIANGAKVVLCEKTSGESRTPEAAVASVVAGPDGVSTAVRAKELRRARAQERAKRQPLLKALRERVAKAETRISELEAELETLSGVLFNRTPDTDYATTNKRLRIVQDQLGLITEEWERDATELTRLQSEQDEAQDAISAPA